jgi:hypothetical protein
VTFALAALLIAVVLAALLLLRRYSAVLNSELRPSSGRQRAFVLALLVLNTLPFAPIWPGTSGGDAFVQDWLMLFVLLSLPFWLMVLGVWRACAKLPPRKRCVAAELPALVLQAGAWSRGYPEAVVVFVALRVVDGVLLYRITRPARFTASAVVAGAA